jgi:hypothetical protein
MNRDKIYKFIKSITFVILLIAFMTSFFSVFRIKSWAGICEMDIFYKLPKNTVDVLVLGSSHAFVNINPAVLFSEYGITSFVLGGSGQPLWNTYFYLCEALKTQKPKAVILEAFYAVSGTEYGSIESIVKNTYGMKPSMRYINALKVSAPKDDFWEYFLRFRRYHNRYTTLSKRDFSPNIEPDVGTWNIGGYNLWIDWKGFLALYMHTPFEKPEVDNVIDRSPMTTKTELYYRAIIELCLKNNIPLEIVVTPCVISSQNMQILNYACDIAMEYAIPFRNFNNSYDYEKIGFDFSLDMVDVVHANHRGNIKISRYIGTILKEKYIINDNRNNQLYATWQRNADHFWRNDNNFYLKEETDIDKYLELIVNSQYIISAYTKDPEILNIDNNSTDLSIRILNRTIPCFNIGSIDRFKQFGSVMISLDKMNNIQVNGIKIKLDENNINLIIYDPVTDKIVDNVSFDFNNLVVIHQ